MKSIPAIFFPAKALIVDNDPNVLRLLVNELDNKNVNFLVAPDASKAQKVLTTHIEQAPNLANILIESFQDDLYDSNTSIVKFNISKLLSVFENYHSYNFIAVIISDHFMPGESGLEFFKRLRNTYYKKILLTAKVSDKKVVEAFNWGVINKYADKAEANLIDKLNLKIKELLLEYFLDVSKNIHFISKKFDVLFDNHFIDLFNKIIKQHNISRFCIIDKSGSFLMISEENVKYVLVIKTDEEIEELIEYCLDVMPEQYLQLLKSHKLIPFFGVGIEPRTYAQLNWDKYLLPSAKLSGTKNYYWGFKRED